MTGRWSQGSRLVPFDPDVLRGRPVVEWTIADDDFLADYNPVDCRCPVCWFVRADAVAMLAAMR